MRSIDPHVLSSNAFRVLQLGATANQADAERAARLLRLVDGQIEPPPTPWDAPQVGPLPRSKSAIDHALWLLSEPQLRVMERLLWFNSSSALAEVAASRGATAVSAADDASQSAAHDRAAAALHAAILFDPDILHPARWRAAVDHAERLRSSDAYRLWLRGVENASGFEKAANETDIAAALRELPESIVSLLLVKFDHALDDLESPRAGRILATIETIGRPAAMDRTLYRLEDRIGQQCDRIVAIVAEQLKCVSQYFAVYLAANQKVAMQVSQAWLDGVQPLLRMAERAALAAKEEVSIDFMLRVRDYAARSLGRVAHSWLWAGEHILCDRIYSKALKLAEGQLSERKIRADRDLQAPHIATAYRARATARSGAVALQILIIACLIGFTYGAGSKIFELWRLGGNTSPTVIDMNDFARVYKGQYWLSLIGKWDVSRMSTIPPVASVYEVMGAKIIPCVPFVGIDDIRGGPVHVIIKFAAIEVSDLRSFKAHLETRSLHIGGTAENDDFDQAGISMQSPAIGLQQGHEPDAVGLRGGAIALSVLDVLLAIVEVAWLVRARRRRKPQFLQDLTVQN